MLRTARGAALIVALALLGTSCATARLPSPSPGPGETPSDSPVASPTANAATPSPPSPSLTATATPAYAPPAHRIAVREVAGRRVLYDTAAGRPFLARGVNMMRKEWVDGRSYDTLFGSRYDPAWVDGELSRLAGLGYNTVRVFLDLCRDDCIADPAGGLRSSYLDHVVDFLARAREHGIVVLVTSNDLPDTADYGNAVPCCDPFAGYRNSVYLAEEGHAAAERYWRDIVGGLVERGAATDAVLGWQLVNEQFTFLDQPPLSLRSGRLTTGDGLSWDLADAAQRRAMVESNLVTFVDRLAAALREIDPSGLVTIGFFAPNEPVEWRVGDNRFVLTRAVLEQSTLDFADLHAYPGGSFDVADHLVQYGVTKAVRMPLLMGEMGGFKGAYASPEQAAEGLVAWQADSCDDFQGWLLWLSAPSDDEVWTDVEGAGVISRALSPLERPEPCDEAGWVRHNLALLGSARASAALPGEPPGAAIDGQEGTQWGAGDHPSQWLEVDLGSAQSVGLIELVVAQYPAGQTRHRVLVGARRGELNVAGVLRGRTTDGDLLALELGVTMGSAVRYVRIETLDSPSWVAWREVRIFARP